jgi:hypothetical protein
MATWLTARGKGCLQKRQVAGLPPLTYFDVMSIANFLLRNSRSPFYNVFYKCIRAGWISPSFPQLDAAIGEAF